VGASPTASTTPYIKENVVPPKKRYLESFDLQRGMDERGITQMKRDLLGLQIEQYLEVRERISKLAMMRNVPEMCRDTMIDRTAVRHIQRMEGKA
jgi:hypothetical protein